MSTPSTIRICYVTTGLGTGGAEMMLCRLIAGMNAGRFRHEVISLTEGGRHVETLSRMQVPVHTLGMPAGRPTLRGLFRLIRLVRRMQPDILAGWMYHGNLAALLARLFLFRKVPVLWNVRQSLYALADEKPGSAAVIRMLGPLSRFTSCVVYNSRVGMRQHEGIGFRKEKSALIPNGVDTIGFAPCEEARRSVRKELGLADDTLLVGRFGRFAPMKDHAAFLDAAALLQRRFPEARYVLVGTQVDDANTELAARIEALGLRHRVQLLGERRDIPRLTAALDLAVSSSAFGEGFPNVMGEAMACAVPCVATDIGDSAWVMGEGGRVVPAGDPQALAGACADVLSLSSEERHALGAAGRRRIEETFSLGGAVHRYEELFERHVAGTPVATREVLCAV